MGGGFVEGASHIARSDFVHRGSGANAFQAIRRGIGLRERADGISVFSDRNGGSRRSRLGVSFQRIGARRAVVGGEPDFAELMRKYRTLSRSEDVAHLRRAN
jgi:hypothetical protein